MVITFHLQELLPIYSLGLAKVQAPSSWTMWAVVVVRGGSWTVHLMGLEITTVATVRMLVLDVCQQQPHHV